MTVVSLYSTAPLVFLMEQTVFYARRKLHICIKNYMQQSLFEKLTGLQPVKKLPEIYETRKVITAFTTARNLSLS
jgi:hypothetical protein